MILACDIGSSETTFGLFNAQVMAEQWRAVSDPSRSPNELEFLLRGMLAARHVAESSILGVSICSVVPKLTIAYRSAFERVLGFDPLVVDGLSPLPIRLDVDEPRLVGADRVVNALAAHRLYGTDTIVIDLGTATTFDCVTADGTFLGGVIAPGVRSGADALVGRTAQLPMIELSAPRHVIGRNTDDAMRSGVVYGAAAEIDGMVERIRAEWPRQTRPQLVATGGLASIIVPHCQEVVRLEESLTLIGLRLAYEALRP